MKDPLTKALYSLNPSEIDCNKERICQIRGTVPVEVKTETMSILGIPMRQINVIKGQCEGKTGFVNERFIDF